MIIHRSLSHKSHQVSWTLLSILADLNHSIVWIVLTFPLISMSFSAFVPSASITTGNISAFTFHSLFFFSSLARSRDLSLFLLSFIIIITSAVEFITIYHILGVFHNRLTGGSNNGVWVTANLIRSPELS